VHTSTITVVVLAEPKEHEININLKDLDVKTTRGSGAGGQHRNKTDTAVQIKHKPTGLIVRSENSKSQHQNKENAMSILRAKLLKVSKDTQRVNRERQRRNQAGSGMRGDKIRTIRLQDDIVIDHETNKKISAKKYIRGRIDLLY
jgi:peptide chain release factor 1